MPINRLVAEGFLAHLWVWLVCTGFALLNLYCVSEAVDRNDSLEGASGIHFWHFIGLPVFSIVFCGILVGPVIMYLQCRIDCSSMRADALCSSLKASFVLCQGVIYILFCTIGFFAPFSDFRQVELAERGISGTQAPGWASINCMTDKNPGSIDVRTDLYSYFVLAGPQWSVAAGKWTQVKKEENWRWFVAPILYNGPIEGCQTKYPLFAICIDNSKVVSPTKCWWDNERRGAWTHMRLMTASHEIEPGEMKKFWDKWVANPYNSSEKVMLHHENLFQFNTPSYDETVAFLEYKRNEYYTLKWKATVGWFAASVPIALIAFLVCVWMLVELSRPSTTEPASCQDVPSTSTVDNPLPYGTEDAEMSAPAKDDDNTTT